MTESKYVQQATADTFDERVIRPSYKMPVLVDFWAPWCEPCKMLAPILEQLAESYAGRIAVVKVNTDEEQLLAGQLGIRSLPTVKIIRNGRIVDEFMGAQPEHVIRGLIDRHLEKPSDRLRAQAREALARGKVKQAIATLRQAAEGDPDNHAVRIDLATALLGSGAADEARQILEALPIDVRQSPEARMLAARLQFFEALDGAPDPKKLARRLESAPDDLKARYQLGAFLLLSGDFEAGLEQLFEIMRRDRKFEDDLGRRSLVTAFEIVDDPALVNRYRQRMAALLF